MAWTMANAPITVRPVKGLDCENYVGLETPRNFKLNIARTAGKSQPSRLFVVRSSERQNVSGTTKKLGLSDAECEAAVVAGNVPEAPPVPPKPESPAGTPVVPSLVSIDFN